MAGRDVLVAGGGADAYRGVLALLGCAARVSVYALRAGPGIRGLAAEGRISWHPREPAAQDFDDTWFVVAAAGGEVDARVLAEARRRHLFTRRVAATAAPAATGGGSVSIVGAGPGDPGLMTVRGQQLLDAATLVVTDRLVPAEVLVGLRPGVELVDVAKFPRGPAASQDRINETLVAGARAGHDVVRLKGGDPFVFGRGLEEMLACARAGIACAVVPGVSSAIGVPGLIGLPVTHRGVTHEFTVVSGHVPPGSPQSLVDWKALAALRGTIVVLMGVEHLAAIAGALIGHGRDGATPVCVVQDGASDRGRHLVSTLADVGGAVARAGVRPPAVTVIGDVVAAASQLAAFRDSAAGRGVLDDVRH
ncbi:uroporphyrinogen-III C-methyltransferase [Symbioplanes lichenis]|uniref:uroporphyrinogen-III C-methyltransferase n=1 Tax=Symbioplanes lichenis TaxID=1629072 RepID=UPI002739ED22|nr:uroporphyrinogen-III C-methyltransferase [Actinoplanes lichenis]